MTNKIKNKAVSSITADEILAAFNEGNVGEVPSYADLMPLEGFIGIVNWGGFIDYDGFGELVIDGKAGHHTTTLISQRSFLIGNKLVVPFKVLRDVFGDRVQVAWYNK